MLLQRSRSSRRRHLPRHKAQPEAPQIAPQSATERHQKGHSRRHTAHHPSHKMKLAVSLVAALLVSAEAASVVGGIIRVLTGGRSKKVVPYGSNIKLQKARTANDRGNMIMGEGQYTFVQSHMRRVTDARTSDRRMEIERRWAGALWNALVRVGGGYLQLDLPSDNHPSFIEMAKEIYYKHPDLLNTTFHTNVPRFVQGSNRGLLEDILTPESKYEPGTRPWREIVAYEWGPIPGTDKMYTLSDLFIAALCGIDVKDTIRESLGVRKGRSSRIEMWIYNTRIYNKSMTQPELEEAVMQTYFLLVKRNHLTVLDTALHLVPLLELVRIRKVRSGQWSEREYANLTDPKCYEWLKRDPLTYVRGQRLNIFALVEKILECCDNYEQFYMCVAVNGDTPESSTGETLLRVLTGRRRRPPPPSEMPYRTCVAFAQRSRENLTESLSQEEGSAWRPEEERNASHLRVDN